MSRALENWLFYERPESFCHERFQLSYALDQIFPASDWSRAFFGFKNDTDVAEGRRIAQKSSFDLYFPKKFSPKVDVWAKIE